MIPKKNPRLDLERYKTLFFMTGVVISLGLCIYLLNLKFSEGPVENNQTLTTTLDDEEMIPITYNQPPPPEKKVIPQVIQVVEDQIILDVELEFASTETDENEIVWADDFSTPMADIEIEEEVSNEVLNFAVVESVPVFPGCETCRDNVERRACFEQHLREFVSEHYIYPQAAREMNIQGKVFVSFIIERDGSVSNVEVVRGVDPLLDKAAIKVIKSLPHIEPATQRGKPVRMSFVMPIKAVVMS